MPCGVELLHENGVSLASGGLADLLDSDVAARADNVAHVDEVVTHEAILCDLRLFAFKAVMDGDDGAGGSVRCWKDRGGAGLDVDGVIVVEAMDFKCLIVFGLIVDVDVMHGSGGISGT